MKCYFKRAFTQYQCHIFRSWDMWSCCEETNATPPLQNGSTSPSQVVKLLLLVQQSKQILDLACGWKSPRFWGEEGNLCPVGCLCEKKTELVDSSCWEIGSDRIQCKGWWWSVYRWGSFQRLIYDKAADDLQTVHVSKQQGGFRLLLDCERQTLKKWGAAWNLVGHLLMQSDTFENPRTQSCWRYESCHLFGTLLRGGWDPAFLHLFNFSPFFDFWQGEDSFPPCFLFSVRRFSPGRHAGDVPGW